jgi:glucans biosynthesis protein
MKYDAFRSIRFRPERSLWRGLPGQFEVQFFHPGFYFREPVGISEVGADGVRPVPFSSDLFSYDGVPAPPRDASLGFVGFRVHAPLNNPSYKDELVAFMGASYFRPLGKNNVYGLSARGLAVDFGAATPEEFPSFREFYLVRPGPNDSHLWILALLDSRRVSGAFAFRFEPGSPTRVEVTAHLFLREPIEVLGLAPLTSMYLFGEERPNRFGDFRPEVHDSDGLSMLAANGEWLYRPLRNPERTNVASFRLDAPVGFGLLQRDRAFASYEDLEARYQDRPSAWVEPIEGFSHGVVRLLEIATQKETDDNVTIAFVPDHLDGRELSLRYRLHVGMQPPRAPSGALVIATRTAVTEQGIRFLVDFAGGELDRPGKYDAVISVQGGRILEQHLEDNPFTHGKRASFEVAVGASAAAPGAQTSIGHVGQKNAGPKGPGQNVALPNVELRAFLRRGADAMSETWSYLWQPSTQH